jgi:hypothetical protein
MDLYKEAPKLQFGLTPVFSTASGAPRWEDLCMGVRALVFVGAIIKIHTLTSIFVKWQYL